MKCPECGSEMVMVDDIWNYIEGTPIDEPFNMKCLKCGHSEKVKP